MALGVLASRALSSTAVNPEYLRRLSMARDEPNQFLMLLAQSGKCRGFGGRASKTGLTRGASAGRLLRFMTWIKSPIVVVVATQLLFTAGDLIARANMRNNPFALSMFLNWWFLAYFLIRQVAMFGQLYVFSALQLGKTMALFGATSIVVVNVLGVLLLGEILSIQAYLAIALVVFAFILLSMSP